MKKTLGTIWTGSYGLVGSAMVFARDAIANTLTRHLLADSATFTREANAYISLASALGGFVIICLSIISLRLKIQIQRQQKNLGERTTHETRT